FVLTILGTFMTRSGVFNSVHSFTQSSIGPTILVFLAAALLFSVVLLALRIDSLESEGKIDSAVSREGMFLVNNLFFVLLTFTLLIGGYAGWVTLVEMWRGGAKTLRRGRRRFGSYVVHAGAVIVLVAIAVSSTMRTSKEVRLTRGEAANIGPYTVTFLAAEERTE